MLRYKIGDEAFSYGGQINAGPNAIVELIPASTDEEPSYVELPDDFLPSHTWEGTDEKSEKAIEVAKKVHQEKQARSFRVERAIRNHMQPDPKDLELVVAPAPYNKVIPPPKKQKVVRKSPRVPADLISKRVNDNDPVR